MVARLIEGWESSTVPADYAGKWSTLTGTGIAVSSAAGRFGNGLRSGSVNYTAQRTFDNQATWVIGFALRIGAIPNAQINILSLMDGATIHCGLTVQDSTGFLYVWRATNGAMLGTPSAVALTPNVWAYIEAKFTISDTVGVAAVRINGVSVINLTAQDTRNAGNASANVVRLGPHSSPSATYDLDDIYILDGTGTTNNDFLGDCKVEQLLPTGAGATTAWTPSAGANWDAVNEVPPNGDTDYVSSATAGQTDTYAFGDLSVATSGTVKCVQATVQARKDDAGSRSLAVVARPGSTDRVGATQAVGDTYAAYPQVWDTNPDTSAAWSVAEVNASSFGVRLIA